MFQVPAAMPTPHYLCHKESEICPSLLKPVTGKVRASSDDLSTAAPSPDASPLFGPEQMSPLCGPGELLLPELSSFELPEAEDPCSEAEFELLGLDHEENSIRHLELKTFQDDVYSASTQISDDDEEDAESQVLALLGELSSLRADAQSSIDIQKPAAGLPKVPYPIDNDTGFLPVEFMATKSWELPSGHAATGQWACLMAPRPTNESMEPLNIVLGPTGATLAVVVPEAWQRELEEKRSTKAKARFRKKPGRSRSPAMDPEELQERQMRGRARAKTWA